LQLLAEKRISKPNVLKLSAKSLVAMAAIAVVVMLATPWLHSGVQQFHSAVGQVLPQEQAPALGSADFANFALAAAPLTILSVTVALHGTTRTHPMHVGYSHLRSLFVRPPPTY